MTAQLLAVTDITAGHSQVCLGSEWNRMKVGQVNISQNAVGAK